MKDKLWLYLFFTIICITFCKKDAYAADSVGDFSMPAVNLTIGSQDEPEKTNSSIQLLLLITIISLAPSILVMMTCFTRIIIAMHFVRTALGTQQMPPNQVLVGISLILTMFVMGPIFTSIKDEAYIPYSNNQITQEQAIGAAMDPLRKFMLMQAEDKDIGLFLELSGETFETKEDISNRILIPAFIMGELTKGFKFGIIIFIPFIVIDMVVASILMAMGMMMLPPSMISLPFKVLIFVLAGGWNLVIENLIKTFRFVP